MGLFSWLRPKKSPDFSVEKYLETKAKAQRAGSVDGKHYTAYVGQVKSLKRRGKFGEAKTLLLKLLNAAEAQSRVDKLGVPPWYYEQLAIIYRQEKEYTKEVDVLNRYFQHDGAGSKRTKLAARLNKAKQLARAQ